MIARNQLRSWRKPAARAAGIAVAALGLCWPAFLNGYPLLYPDSLEYLGDGHALLISLHDGGVPWFISKRSEFYTGALVLLHRGPAIWPVVAAQALLTAWVVWQVVRSLCRRTPLTLFLSLMAMLSIFTSVGWYVSFVMPDILGPLLYLCLYLIVFAFEALRRWERVAVAAIAWWAATAHGSHLLLALLECGLLSLLWLLGWSAMKQRGRLLLAAMGVVALAGFSQMAVHRRMYGSPSLFGVHPPYLMARVIADGPAALYLQQHCRTLSWTICDSVDRLPATEDDFLWPPQSIWQRSTPEQQKHLRSEEMPLVLNTLRTYPRQQAERSWKNFVAQLTTMGPNDFWDSPALKPSVLDTQTSGLSRRYARTLQSHNAMPQDFFNTVQKGTIAVSLLAIAALLPWAWRRGPLRLLGLAAVVLTVVPANAAMTGVLSGLDDRYQGRVVWLLALLAGLMVYAWSQRHQKQEVLGAAPESS